MHLKEINQPQEKEQYNQLAHQQGNIFNTLDWLKNFKPSLKLFGIYNNNEKLISGFYLYKEKKSGLTIYRNPPFTPYNGPIINLETKNAACLISQQKRILNLVGQQIEALPGSVVSIALNKEIQDGQPFIWRKFKVIPAYTYILNLQESLGSLKKKMSPSRRNDISKAIKDKIKIKQSQNFKLVRSLILQTFARQKKQINQFYLNKILFNFANRNNSFALVAFKNKLPLATVFCVFDQETAFYLLGGYNQRVKHHGAGALAIWQAIKQAQSLGLKKFDFEGSMQPQIERYFRGFGGQLVPYLRINKAKLPLEIILKFFKRELF